MATLQEVAKIAGVSTTTASRVLNRGKYAERISDAAAQRVREAATRVGYTRSFPHRSIRTGRAETLGMAMEIGGPQRNLSPNRLTNNTYFHSLISGVEAATHNLGYALTLIGPSEDRRATVRGIEGIRERRLDGLVVVGTQLGHVEAQSVVPLLADGPELPIVVVQPAIPTRLTTVDFDETAAAKLTVSHLAEFGHREVLWVGASNRPELDQGVSPRENAFMTAVWDAGLRGASCRYWFDHESTQQPDRLRTQTAEAAFERYLSERPRSFTAAVCQSDVVAMVVCRVLTRRGIRVPQDVSVVGFDDAQAELANPALTTIDHRLAEIGQRAGELALTLAMEPNKAASLRGSRQIIQPRLIVRESTGPAPA